MHSHLANDTDALCNALKQSNSDASQYTNLEPTDSDEYKSISSPVAWTNSPLI